MKKIKVSLKTNPYEILISQNEKEFFSSFKQIIKSKNLYVITDSTVSKIHLQKIIKQFNLNGYKTNFAIIQAGEKGKSIKSLTGLYEDAFKKGIDRKSVAVALGGGVVGDVCGFFSATYMRGIKFVQIPTTLLAMTDSSVGGKTAVNISTGKNIAGAFYQPSFVWINPKFLQTLPLRQIINGLAEVIKYAFIMDKKFYTSLRKIIDTSIITTDNFTDIIFKSCSYKVRIVKEDEKETKGIREILNFGHTLAHAIETSTGFVKILHGEAVAIGMLFAAKLSNKLKFINKETYLQIEKLIKDCSFDCDISYLNSKTLLQIMKKDKKNLNGQVRFVLLKSMGKAITNYAIKDEIILKELESFKKENK